jgi:anti-sigma regulatory factor (Ser/Thr protein kinase)
MNDLLGAERADDARLLTSELISNAIRHGDVPDTGAVTVDVRDSASSVTIAVTQPTSVGRVGLRSREAPQRGGVGLRLVDQLADEWGVTHGIPGSVWFGVLRRPG